MILFVRGSSLFPVIAGASFIRQANPYRVRVNAVLRKQDFYSKGVL